MNQNEFYTAPDHSMYNDQTLYDIISGRGSVRVSVELSMTTIIAIFIAFVLAGVVSRLLIS
jgi:hypothetical protein